jgi:regulatory protein
MKHQITDLKTQKNHPSRLSIFIDDKYYCGVSEEVATKYQLEKGMEVDENELNELLYDEELLKAKKYVYSLLSRRMYSSKEVHDKLAEQGYIDEVINGAISAIERFGYINDRKFAEEWVSSRMRTKPKGEFVLRRELAEKGIEGDVIEEILTNTFDDSEKLNVVLDIARKKAKSYKNDDPLSARRKLQSFLVRRGFDFETVRNVVDKVLNEQLSVNGE